MAELLIARKTGQILRRIDLTDVRRLSIGRSTRCEVSLPSPSISRRQALLFEEAGRWVIVPVRSPRSVRVAKGFVRRAVLGGDVWARVGSYFLWVNADPPRGNAMRGRAMQAPALLRGEMLELVDAELLGRTDVSVQKIVNGVRRVETAGPTLVVADGTGKPIRRIALFGKEKLTIGRSPESDLILTHPTVSRHHTVLYTEGVRWCVADAGSKAGTRVEGKPTLRRRLKESMIVEIGGLMMWAENLLPTTAPERVEPVRPEGSMLSAADGETNEGHAPLDATISAFLTDEDVAPIRSGFIDAETGRPMDAEEPIRPRSE